MSDISSRSLQLSSSKLYVEHNMSDSEVNVGNKRRKISLSTPVAMESENPEPVVMKRKRTSGHIFEGKKLKEETVPAELALGQTEKLSCKETKQVPSNSKEGCVNQILPEQKQAFKDKGTENEIDRLRKKIEKKCKIRMAKLLQEQRVEFEEFDRIWEKKMSDLQGDNKLEQAFIRSIYGIGSRRTNNKLKLLDVSFIAKVNELNLLKDVERKKLKAEQLAARDEERQKRAQWLAECGSDEPTANHVPESEEVGCDVIKSLSTGPRNDPGVAVLQNDQLKNICPRQIICALSASRKSVPGQIEVVELNKEVSQDVPETVPIEIVDCASPMELINSTSDKGIDNGDAIGSSDVLMNLGDETDEANKCFNERDAIGSPDALMNLGEETDEANKFSNEKDAIGSPDALMNLGDETDQANKCLNETSEQGKASWIPRHCTSLLPQASGDQIPCSSSNDIIQDDIGAQVNSVQDQSAQVVENHNASPFEMAASVHVDTVTDVQPNIELQDQDATDFEDQSTSWIEVASSEPIDVVNPVLCSVGAPAVLNGEELLSVHVSPVVELEIQSHNLEGSSSQTAEIADTAVVSYESATQLVENQDLQKTHFGNGSESQVNLENISSKTAEITDTVMLSHESCSHIGENQDLQSNHFGTGSGSQVNLERNTTQTAETTESGVVSHESSSQLGGNRDLQSNHLGLGSGSQVNLERISSQTAEITENLVVSHVPSSQLGENQDLQRNHFGVGSGSQVNLERISSQTAEITDTVVISHETSSHIGQNRDLQSNHFAIGSGSQVTLERISSQTAPITDTVMLPHESTSQLGVIRELQSNHFGIANTVELPHQPSQQLGSGGNLVYPFSLNQIRPQPVYAAPLHRELGMISKEIEQLHKSHEDMKLQLKSDCEKEAMEMLARINRKYNLKFQEAEAEFSHKKNGLDKNRSILYRNRLLAEVLGSNCRDLSLLQGIQQASTSSSMQHQNLQHSNPIQQQLHSNLPVSTSNIQQQLHSNPIPIQTTQNAPSFSFAANSQSQVINPTNSPTFGGNVGPQQQPSAASFMPTPNFPSYFQRFQVQPSQSLQPSTFQNRPQLQGEPPAVLNASLSAPGFIMGIPATSLEHYYLAGLRNVQGNRTSSAALNTSISISDED